MAKTLKTSNGKVYLGQDVFPNKTYSSTYRWFLFKVLDIVKKKLENNGDITVICADVKKIVLNNIINTLIFEYLHNFFFTIP